MNDDATTSLNFLWHFLVSSKIRARDCNIQKPIPMSAGQRTTDHENCADLDERMKKIFNVQLFAFK